MILTLKKTEEFRAMRLGKTAADREKVGGK